MNKRIDKLFEQALEEFTVENKYATIIVPNPLKEKFAELIVKECGVALSPMLRDMVSRGQAHDLIKQHFGVTE
jgi:hypothetical protein